MSTQEVVLLKNHIPTIKRIGHQGYHGLTEYASTTINGIEISGEGQIIFNDRFRASGWSTREPISLDEQYAERLGKFCTDYLATPRLRDFTCITATNYICGFTDTVASQNTQIGFTYESEPSDQLETGKPYLAVDTLGVIQHEMLGSTDSGSAFGVIGPIMPMEIVDTNEIKRIFRAKGIYALVSAAPV